MKFDIIFLTIGLGTNVVCAQDIKLPPNRIPVHQPDAYVWVMVLDGDIKSSKLENEKTYYWLKAKQIHSSKGGYDGDLLHGEYTALYKNDALKEKGLYVKGLKHGTWKTWHINGELSSITHWKNGIQTGMAEYKNAEGKKIKIERFKHGQLHGKQFYYSDSLETIKRFKNGRELVISSKKEKRKEGRRVKEEVNNATSEKEGRRVNEGGRQKDEVDNQSQNEKKKDKPEKKKRKLFNRNSKKEEHQTPGDKISEN